MEDIEHQLKKARADEHDRQKSIQDYPETFAKIILMTDDQLKERSRFSIDETADGSGWSVVTAQCCLNGCDLNVYTFPSKRDALLYSVLLRSAGYRPPHNSACTSCYQQYMKDCI